MSKKSVLREVLQSEAEVYRELAEALLEVCNKLAFVPDEIVGDEGQDYPKQLAAIRQRCLTECFEDPWDQMVANDLADAVEDLERVAV